MKFSQQQLEIGNLAQLDVCGEAHAHLQGQGGSALELQLLVIKLNRDRETVRRTYDLDTCVTRQLALMDLVASRSIKA